MARWFTYFCPNQFLNWFKMTGKMDRRDRHSVCLPGHRALLFLIHEGARNTVHTSSVLTVSKNHLELRDPAPQHPQSSFVKSAGFFIFPSLNAARAACSLAMRLLEDVTMRKGEMCLAQAKIIHSRYMCNAGETGANNWTSCQQATGIAFDILIVSWSMRHIGNITVIVECTSVNLF